MVTLQDYFQLNDEVVAAQVIEGEAILINFSNCVYYSMDKVGAFIWELILLGLSIGNIVEAIVAIHDVGRDRVQADIERLVEALMEENILFRSLEASKHPENPNLPQGPTAYETPVLNVYRDLGDLLVFEAQ